MLSSKRVNRDKPRPQEHARTTITSSGTWSGSTWPSTPTPPSGVADWATVMRRWWYVAAGGTSVGQGLLKLCAAASIPLKQLVPDVQVVLVAGPRIATDAIDAPDWVDVLGYVARLHEFFAASDDAVVQCGASSTTELAALGRPFIFAPIEGHFEQEVVAARLERHNAGRRMPPGGTQPAALAQMVFEELARAGSYVPIPADGATRAARHVLEVLEKAASAVGRRHEVQLTALRDSSGHAG